MTRLIASGLRTMKTLLAAENLLPLKNHAPPKSSRAGASLIPFHEKPTPPGKPSRRLALLNLRLSRLSPRRLPSLLSDFRFQISDFRLPSSGFRLLASAFLISGFCLLTSAPMAQASCTSPADPAGTMIYNKDYHVPQYCDGTKWMQLGQKKGVGGSGCAAAGTYPVAGENAIDVLGEPDFTTQGAGVTTQSGFNYPQGAAYDAADSLLFVSDYLNNRVLVFNLSGGITDGMNATYVLGQANFTSGSANEGGTTAQNSLFKPAGLAWDSTHKRLFVADPGNNRVLVYSLSGGITTNMNASYVLGHSNFTASSNGLTQARMNWPAAVAYDSANDRLFVGETNNNRVLVFDVSSTAFASCGVSSACNAAHVLGQADFVSGTANRGGSTAANTLSNAAGVAYDPADSRLFVSDYANNRVLEYDVGGGITDGMNATHVLGQTDFTSNGASETQSTMFHPLLLAWDSANRRLFITENGLNRITEYDLRTGLTDGMNAAHVLGQADFVSSNTSTTQSTDDGVGGVAYDSTNQRLFMSDTGNNRVMVFPVPYGSGPGAEGDVIYNADKHAPQFCGGTNWIPMAEGWPTSGLVGYWKLDDGSGATATDSSGNGNTGTVSSGTWTTGKINGALSGATHEVDVPDGASLQLAGDWTVSEWVNVTALPAASNQGSALERDTGSPYYLNYGLYLFGSSAAWGNCNNGVWTVFYEDSTGNPHCANATTAPSLNTWYLLTGTYVSSSKTLSLYVNGVLASAVVQTAAPVSTPSGGEVYPAGVGINAPGNSLNAIGDDARIYNRVLSASEIAALAMTTGPTTGCNPTTSGLVGWWKLDNASTDNVTSGLVDWWKFDETSGTSAADSAGSATGALNNGPTWGTGEINGDLTLNGTSQYVSASASLGSGGITVSAWVYPTGNGAGGFDNILKEMTGGAATRFLCARDHALSDHLVCADSQLSSPYAQTSSAIPLNQWTFVTMTRTAAGVFNLYINGALNGSANQSGGSTFSDGATVLIGGDTGNYYFAGSIDDTRVYNRVLSAAEIAQLYAWHNTSVAVDSSGNGNTGTLQNSPTWTSSGKIGGALTLSHASNTYVDIANPSNFNFEYNQPLTLTAWIYRTDTTTEGDLIAKHASGGAGYDIWMLPDGGSYHSVACTTNCISGFVANNTNANNDIFVMASGSSATPNAWHFVAMTYDGSNTAAGIKIYVDGVSQTVSAGTDTLSGSITVGADLKIGTDVPADNDAFTGTIDDARVYNRALSPTEVATLYNGGREGDIEYNSDAHLMQYCDGTNWQQMGSRENTAASGGSGSGSSGLIGWWKLDDGTGDVTAGEPAAYVLGQPDFTTGTGALSQAGMNGPGNFALDAAHNRLFVPDYTNSRVLEYDTSAISNGMNAAHVLGQGNFTTGTAAHTSTGMSGPLGAAYDSVHDRLFVADTNNSRVLEYDFSASNIVSDNFNRASLGSNWTSYTTGSGGWSINGSDTITETSNDTVHRYLEWNANTFSNNQFSQITITSLASAGANRYLDACVRFQSTDPDKGYCYSVQRSGSSYCGLYRYDGGSVTALSSTGGANCIDPGDTIRVEAVGSSITAYKNGSVIAGPFTDTTYTSGLPGIATYQNNGQVKGDNWSAGDLGIKDGMAASHVLGQPDFTSNQTNQGGANPAANTLYWPYDVAYDSVNDRLFVLDTYNSRVLEYDFSAPTTSGLVGWWKLDESSGTTAADSSGTGNTGTLNNSPTWISSGKINGALSFNGTSQYVGVPDAASLRLAGPWTVSAWVNLNALPPSSHVATISAKQASSGYNNYELDVNNVNGCPSLSWEVQFDSGGTTYRDCSAATINTGTWYHVAATWDGTTLSLYANGALGSTATPGHIPNSTSGRPLSIGSTAGSNYLNGTLDDVRVYNRALSAAEVAGLYNNGLSDDMVANHVLGQADFVSGQYNRCNCTTVAANTLWHPDGLDFDSTGQRLFVADFDNNRVLEYDFAAPPTNGLVGWWKMDEGSGASAADSSGNGNTGTLQNSPTWTSSGKISDALTFNGINQYVVIPADPISGASAFTVSYWMKWVSFGTGIPISIGNSIACTAITGSTMSCFSDGNNSDGAVEVTALNTGNWFHITFVVNGTVQKIYVNGVLEGTENTHGTSTAGVQTVIGNKYDFSASFDGTIDDVRVYNRALNATEVADLYNNGAVTDGMNATYVLGQASMTTRGSATTQSTMNEPVGLGIDPAHNRLFVGDDLNNRVLEYDLSGSITNGMNAANELGQPTGATQWTTSASATTQSGLYKPHKAAYDAVNNRLFVDDSGNNRVMVFPATALGAGSLTDGLAGWWKLDDASSGTTPTTAADSSGNGQTGTNVGSPTWTGSGKIGDALTFNGSSQELDLPAVVGASSVFTAAFWFKASASSGTIFAYGNYVACDLTYSTSHVSCSIDGGTASELSDTAVSVTNGAWHHIAVTEDGTIARLYIDGALGVTNTLTPNISGAGWVFASDGGTGYQSGTFDDIRIYNRVLSAAEIAALYNNASGPTTAADSSGNNNTGTLTNGPVWTTGKLGGALSFNGSTSQYVDVGNASTLNFERTQPFSLAAWVHINSSPPTTWNYIFSKQTNSGNFPGVVFYAESANQRLDVQIAGTTAGCGGTDCIYEFTPFNSLSLDAWHHVVITYDGSSTAAGTKIYIDGVSQTLTVSKNGLASSILSSADMTIGYDLANSTYTAGTIDDVRVYNRALSAAEIRDLYDAGN
jgi:Concanavalin A-like lectin/glucanases superfamily